MAIDVRTIQMRRGLAVDFNPAKMVPGEWAVSQDNEKLYMCFTAGRVIEIATTGAIISYVEDAEAWAIGTRDGVPVDNSQPQYENNSKYYAEIEAVAEVRNAEAWARGTRNNVNVPDTDPAYHNNSKYYAEVEAVEEVQNAEAWAVGQRAGTDVPSTDPNYHNNSKYYSEQSDASATASAVSASNAATSEDNAEAWARGTKNGTDVPSTDPQYHNNSKYYSEIADSRANDAEDHKENSEAWAVGTKNGVPVSSSDPQYQNSAKDWAEAAEAIVGIGIATTERAGIVKPDGETILVEPDGEILAPNVNSATEDFVKDTVGWTGKNLIPFPYRDNASKVVNGVTFTLNDDGSVTVQTVETGATADSNFTMRWRSDTPVPYIPLGNYYISGCPDGGSTSTYYIEFNCTYNGAARSYGKLTDSASVLITRASGETGLGCGITIKSGCIITTPIIFKPMLRKASVNDATYEPYHPSVKQTLRDAEVIEGKNLIPYPYRYARVNGNPFVTNEVTYTQNLDGSLSVSGTASGGNANYYLTDWRDGNDGLIKAGTYTLSGCPSGGATDTYCLILYCFVVGSNGTEVSPLIHKFDTGEGTTFTLQNDVWSRIYFRVANGATAPSGTVYPMLRYATEEDATYEPYYIPLKDSKFDRSEQGILGAKNLIPYPYHHKSGRVNRGITFTWDDKGIVYLNGTPSTTGQPYFNLVFAEIRIEANRKYYLACETDIAAGFAVVYFLNDEGTGINVNITYEYEDGTTGTVNQNYISLLRSGVYHKWVIFSIDSTCPIQLDARVNQNSATITNGYEKITLGLGDVVTPWQPIACTNRQLTTDKMSYEDNAITGVHNLLPYPYSNTTFTVNGVTFTDNGDGTVLINIPQTATNKANFWCYSFNIDYMNLSDGTYIISKSGHSNIACGVVYYLNSTWKKQINATENDETFVINKSDTSYNNIGVVIYVPANTTSVSNLLIKPQIRLASDPYSEYTQYAMTNKELTNATLSAQSDISTIQGEIPSGASSSNKFATASDITNINNKIPSGASSSNKLATQSQITSLAAADMHIYPYDTPTTSIAANSYKDVTIDGSSIFSSGEEMLGIVGYTFSGTTAQYLSLYNCTVGIGDQKIVLGIHNSSGSAASTSVKLKIMYRNAQ